MLSRFGSKKESDMSFVPEDYRARKAERRTNLVYMVLFSVTMFGIVGAFFVTNREWNDVKHYQEAINVQFAQAAQDIEQVKTLEEQKTRLLARAELTTALIEKVPRSVMMAELINRAPEEMTLLEFELKSKRTAQAPTVAPPKKDAKSLSSNTKERKDDKANAAPQPVVPRFETTIMLVGITPTHREVAEYVRSLQDCELLKDVSLRYSEFTIIEEMGMNKFRIDAELDSDIDARAIQPTMVDESEGEADMAEADGETATETADTLVEVGVEDPVSTEGIQ